MGASGLRGRLRRAVRRLRASAARRHQLDRDIDRVNEIANGLAAASLALYADDDEAARRAVRQTLTQASDYLSLSIDRQRTRERRRRSVLASGTAAGLVAAAAFVVVAPSDQATRTHPVPQETPGDRSDVALMPDVPAPAHLDRRSEPPGPADLLVPPATLIGVEPPEAPETALVDVRPEARAADALRSRTAVAPQGAPAGDATAPGGATGNTERGDQDPAGSGPGLPQAEPARGQQGSGQQGAGPQGSGQRGPGQQGSGQQRPSGGEATFSTASIGTSEPDRGSGQTEGAPSRNKPVKNSQAARSGAPGSTNAQAGRSAGNAPAERAGGNGQSGNAGRGGRRG